MSAVEGAAAYTVPSSLSLEIAQLSPSLATVQTSEASGSLMTPSVTVTASAEIRFEESGTFFMAESPWPATMTYGPSVTSSADDTSEYCAAHALAAHNPAATRPTNHFFMLATFPCCRGSGIRPVRPVHRSRWFSLCSSKALSLHRGKPKPVPGVNRFTLSPRQAIVSMVSSSRSGSGGNRPHRNSTPDLRAFRARIPENLLISPRLPLGLSLHPKSLFCPAPVGLVFVGRADSPEC